MPTYSYRCTQCSTAFDIHQSFTDDALTLCDTCGGTLRKVFSPVGIAFKGSGFYRTDSAAASAPKGGDSTSSTADATPAAAPAATAAAAPATAGAASAATASAS